MYRLILILILLLSTPCLSAQPCFHTTVAYTLNSCTDDSNKWLLAPIIGLTSHIMIDEALGTSGLPYERELGVIRPVLLSLILEEDERAFFLWSTFWALAPDLVDKDIFHRKGAGSIYMDSYDTARLESWSILIFSISFN